MRILVVEDNQALLDQLCDAFRDRGDAVDPAADGQEALFLGQEYEYDLVVLDLGLPGIDGITVLSQWRREQRNFPVLILTARDRWQDKVEGLEAGADDYLAKPFQMEELLARANALVRRSSGHASPKLVFGPLLIDTAARQAFLEDKALELTGFEYNALELLARKAGEVVSKTELTEHLYDQDFDRDSNVIEVFIARLRKKLDPQGGLKPIATVRGQGYRFDLAPAT